MAGRIRTALGLEARSYENPAQPLTSRTLLDALGNRMETDAGIGVSEQSALTFGAVFSCVQILARGVGLLPVKWYHRADDGSKAEATTTVQHQLVHTQPNREQTPAVFKETLQGHIGLGGNAYARIFHDGAGRPAEVYPLDPGATTAERTLYGWDLRYLTSWQDQHGLVLEPEEVLHVPGLGFDGITGYSPVGLARQGIGVGLAAEQFTARLFKNGAWLSGIFEHQGKLGPQALENLRASLSRKQGSVNAWSPLILEEGMKWHQATMPAEDAVFLTLRKFQRREVCAMYQVPPHMVADLEGGASFSSIEQMGAEFVMFTLGPWLVKWEQELTRKLSTRRGDFAEFDVSELLRAAAKDRGEFYDKGRQAGWLSVNDIRRRENLAPIPNGDTYLQPLNMAPLGSQPKPTVQPEGRELPAAAAPGNLRELLAQAHRQLLVDVCSRLVRLEVDRASRASSSKRTAGPDAFRSWAEAFYREQVERGMEALAAAARVVAVAAAAGEPAQLDAAVREALAAHLLEQGQERARELARAHQDGKLDQLLQAWQLVRAERMADELLRAIVGAVQPLAA